MIVGTTIMKLDGNAFYSPSFPRGGLGATFVAEVLNIANSPDLTVTVQHRNEEDTSFSDADAFAAMSSTGVFQKDITGLKEIVRFKYEFDAGDASNATVHFLMQAPSWRPY